MEYRISVPEDLDFDNEDEEREAMHSHVQGLMHESGPNEFLDSLLMVANMCEARAITSAALNPSASAWYTKLGVSVRAVLEDMTIDNTFALPNLKLEDPFLYHSNTSITH